ncbi:MAG: hypothetical protein HQM14_02185 [SAR324 cluster bacterium]|nr:hypothetical protein [SAR324 cluster bacterium]
MNIERLQGTDGIRGRVQKQSECSVGNPVSAFVELNVLTDAFFELYSYCYCQELLEAGFAELGDTVVIGWDPRDREGVFNRAAIHGIRKSGLNVVNVGILPTPAIALYTLYTDATCGFVLTASHNPSDQNGIKIFLGNFGLKLFPSDDQHFTMRILKTDYHDLLRLPLNGSIDDHHVQASNLFVQFSLNTINSWLHPDIFHQSVLVIDAANGAYSDIIKRVFEQISALCVIYTNCDLGNSINKNSGVADLEGIVRISSQMVTSSGIFFNYDTLQQLFKEGRARKNDLKKGYLFCSAIVFDGDGDRFFRLDYDPFCDDVIVISGDKLAYFQGQYLINTFDWGSSEPKFINTVESDLEASLAAQKLGFKAFQSAVGDKWILWQAVLEDWKVRCDAYRTQFQFQGFIEKLDAFEKMLAQMQQNSTFHALVATQSFCDIEQYVLNHFGEHSLHTVYQNNVPIGRSRFAIGCEESGHVISLGILQKQNMSKPVYIGNGLKSALNTFAAIDSLRPEDMQEYYRWLHKPFLDGYQNSSPIYYVNKQLLEPNCEFRMGLQSYLLDFLKSEWSGIKVQEVFRSEEPQMLYFLIKEHNEPIASIFVRNSGTEDKMSLYFRSGIAIKNKMTQLHDFIYQYLLPRVKDKNNLFAQIELSILKQINSSPLPDNQIVIKKEFISFKDRVIKEMSIKQNLIFLQNDKWNLTELGQLLLNYSERSEKKLLSK